VWMAIVRGGIVWVAVVRLPGVSSSIETRPLRIVALRLDHLDRPEFPVGPGMQLLSDTTPAPCKQA
jgi:hypothetical protein